VGDRVKAFLAALAILVATAGAARAEPDTDDLLWAGLAMTPPTYFIGVVTHEGTHAIAAKLVGAELVSISFLPGRDPQTGAFHFGLTRVRGLKGTGEKVFFYISPKLVDIALIGGFGALVLTDNLPRNRYGQLALTVLATGFWVDFSKDVLAFRDSNDVVKIFNLWCITGWKRQLAARLVYTGAIAGLGYLVYRGYDKTFSEPDEPSPRTTMLPLFTTSF
jgi:hypothetical protein